jgi:hypothetical protein
MQLRTPQQVGSNAGCSDSSRSRDRGFGGLAEPETSMACSASRGLVIKALYAQLMFNE